MDAAPTAAILAGGKSSRMGTDKALIEINGQPLIERALHAVGQVTARQMILSNNPERFSYPGVPVYPDLIPGKGPLGGIYTALTHALTPHILVVAVDMPHLVPALLAHLLSLRAGFDVVAPTLEGYPQGTLAVYGKGCLPFIKRDLRADRLKLIGFYGDVKVRYVPEDELLPYDPDLRSFTNINTPDELANLDTDNTP